MTNEEIQRHIEQNCRNAHGEPMMDEQAFYEGAKWMRDKALSLGGVVGRSEQLKCPVCSRKDCEEVIAIKCNDCQEVTEI